MNRVKIVSVVIFFLSSVLLYAQEDVYKQFSTSRDSLFELQNRYREQFEQFKESDVKKADGYSKLSNECFDKILDLVIDYVDKYAKNDVAKKILDENTFMFEISHDASFKLINMLKKHEGFDEKLKLKVQKSFDRLSESRMVDKIAPDFSLLDKEGRVVTLSDYRGQYVWLNFWASWCSPCRAKNRSTVSMYKELKDKGVVVLSVSMDETDKLWIEAEKKDQICWLSLRDTVGFKNSIIKNNYKVSVLPTTFLIDKNGKILLQNPLVEDILTRLQ